MPTIDNLTNSFLDMAEDEKFALIKSIRESRRYKPPEPKPQKKTGKGKRSAETSILGSGSKVNTETLLKTLSKGQKLALLKELGVKA